MSLKGVLSFASNVICFITIVVVKLEVRSFSFLFIFR